MSDPERHFVSFTTNESKKVLRIWSSPIINGPPEESFNGGWKFQVCEIKKNEFSNEVEEIPVRDNWDVYFDIIIQCPEEFSDEKLHWVDGKTGEKTNLLEVLSDLLGEFLDRG